MTNLASADAMEAALREIGHERYHNLHPFHRLLHTGRLSKGQVQAWALNRYLYQSRIPRKDAALLARCEDADLRRAWLVRILDHDGNMGAEGGIVRWLHLCEGLGLDPGYVESEAGALPATRFAVDAYVRFVAERTLLEAVASSLTELFAPNIHNERIPGMLAGYGFVSEDMMAYFRHRLGQAPRDAGFALDYAKEHADTPEKRRLVCEALLFKCDVLWSQLDALHHAYVLDGGIPPGRFAPAPEDLALRGRAA
ncbi:MAG: pyrroloquinoline-quinone synthase PqqC [Geminicoccaceae bacterium]|nr:pyrroloquinoline-quinone synthase PqqC [Geminicoccaceae bacterium]